MGRPARVEHEGGALAGRPFLLADHETGAVGGGRPVHPAQVVPAGVPPGADVVLAVHRDQVRDRAGAGDAGAGRGQPGEVDHLGQDEHLRRAAEAAALQRQPEGVLLAQVQRADVVHPRARPRTG